LLALNLAAHAGVTTVPDFIPFLKGIDDGSSESAPLFQSSINEIRGYASTDTLAAVTSDNTSRIAGFTSESSSAPDVNLLGLNGIAVSGQRSAVSGQRSAGR